MRALRTIVWICTLTVCGRGVFAAGGGLRTFTNAVWVASAGNDGDSFAVRLGQETRRVRLYLVDAPEVTTRGEGMAARVATQRRYFGAATTEQVLACGRQASALTEARLREPFTVHTRFHKVKGDGDRIYGYVRCADGEDLATVLVAAGLARVYGYGHATPDGLSAVAARARLSEVETAARGRGAGLWGALPDAPLGTPVRRKSPAPRKPPRVHPPAPLFAPLALLLALVVVLVIWAGMRG